MGHTLPTSSYSLLLILVLLVTRAASQLPLTLDLTWFQTVEGFRPPEPAVYKFQEFPYTETRRNEALFREYVKACEQSPSCWHLDRDTLDTPVELTNCVRQCISPACYSALYTPDPLEQGEIDTRLTSFKGCFHHQLQARHHH